MEAYRVITTAEESEYERTIGELAKKLFSRRNNVSGIALNFIAPDLYGDIEFENPTVGFARGSRQIFVRRGLDDRDLVLTIAHEVRHTYQAQTGKHCLNKEFREQDARIYELEINPPQSGPELRKWLLRELMFETEPGVREAYARAEAVMQQRKTAESMCPVGAPELIASSKGERVSYLRKLLSRLPDSPQYKNQRATLAAELNERLKEAASYPLAQR